MRLNERRLKNLIGKALNETLDDKANKIVEKLKNNLNELGGMEDEHPIFGKLNAGKMSRKEMSDLMKKHYGKGFDDEDSEEDESSTEDGGLGIPDDMPSYKTKYRYSDKDKSGFRDIESFKKRRDYKKGMAESHDSEEMFIATGGKKYNPKTYKNLPLGKGEISIDDELLDDLTGSEPIRYMSNDIKRMMRRRRRDDDNDGGEVVAGREECKECGTMRESQVCECGGMVREGKCQECGMKSSNINEFEDMDFDFDELPSFDTEGKYLGMTKDSGGMDVDSDGLPSFDTKGEYLGMTKDLGDMDVNESQIFEYETYDINDENQFDYTEDVDMEDEESPEDIVKRKCEEAKENGKESSVTCKSMMKYLNQGKGGELDEKLYGKQRNLDHNKNGRIDSEDLRMARQKGRKRDTDGEVEEGNAFSGALDDARDEGRKTFEVGGKTYNVRGKSEKNDESKKIKESYRFTESELITLIENVVLEQKEKLKNKVGQPKGMQKYKQSHEKSGKSNKENITSVGKKMKEYLKGTEGDFEMNPKKFPMGNGELKKSKKKAYQISDDGKEFLNKYQRPGMENLDYDEIHPNEDWMTDNIEGSSRTGNNPKWANAVETDVNKNINKKRKQNDYAKAKRAAFQKAPQPIINDKTGDEDGTGIHIDLGKPFTKSPSKKEKKMNEEFDRMKNLISYDRKTQ